MDKEKLDKLIPTSEREIDRMLRRFLHKPMSFTPTTKSRDLNAVLRRCMEDMYQYTAQDQYTDRGNYISHPGPGLFKSELMVELDDACSDLVKPIFAEWGDKVTISRAALAMLMLVAEYNRLCTKNQHRQITHD